MQSKEEIERELKIYNQEHLLRFWNELNEHEREHLLDDIRGTDLKEITDYYNHANEQSNQASSAQELDSVMQPVSHEQRGSVAGCTSEQLKAYENEGLKAIANNQVAVLLLAGGQGTRLGVTYPKGMYSVSLPSNKTLYQLQAERLIKLKQLADRYLHNDLANAAQNSITWYIMTSEHTKDSTEKFFDANNYFGLNKKNVIFFEQFMLPSLTSDGKIILDEKHKLSKSPDGNGGLYKALKQRHIIDDMAKRGIKYVHIYGVDNILVKMADPAFIGFCISKNANCGAKVVQKEDPEEKVGVICRVNDRYQVVEYSEISQVTRNLREPNGELTYNAGSICNHFMTYDFLNELCNNNLFKLKHHIAQKKIPFVDDSGTRVEPSKNNGIKLEKFVFDVFPYSNRFAIWEVYRDQEFSPLKNSIDFKNENSLTCKNDLLRQHLLWLKKAGANISENDEVNLSIEISPLVSYSGEDLESIVKDQKLSGPMIIEFDRAKSTVTLNNGQS